MRSKRMNNKGFSLVELIVVMAIMAILAVTLAPRLTHYIDKARTSSDQQVASTILNAAKLSLADETLSTELNKIITGPPYVVDLGAQLGYTSADGKTWTPDGSTGNKFVQEFQTVVGDFTLKSTDAVSPTAIKISAVTNGALTVTIDYRNDGSADITVSE